MTATGPAPDATPAFAVVIPALDPGAWLHRALASVLGQTSHDWEAVVVDDGSSEDLSWCADIDPRVRLVRRPHAGVSAARNAGVDATTAPWIAFLDADDEWLPDKLETMARRIALDQPDVAYSSFYWHSPDGVITATYDRPATYADLLAGASIFPTTALVRRDVFVAAGGFDTAMRLSEDTDLWLRLTRAGSAVAVEGTPLARYYTHPAGASQRYWAVHRSRRALLRRELRGLPRTPANRDTRACARRGLAVERHEISLQAFHQSRASLHRRQLGQFLDHYCRSLVLDPVAVTRETLRWATAQTGVGREAR